MKNYTDIFIIGGGINGSAVARDAAGRGLSVTLCEKNDLGSGTSSKSSKLIHGGLRYLEFFEIGLVKEALKEREILLQRAPFLVSPLEFVLPHEKHLRPRWMIRLGLFLYDHLSKRKLLPGSKGIDLKNDPRGLALLPEFTQGFSYYDCFTNDTRFVILNAVSAKEYGATILTHTEFISAERAASSWKITVKNLKTSAVSEYYAKILINIAGPWVKETQQKIHGTQLSFDITLDKGSHFLIPKLYEGDFAYILQNIDNRVIFTIPYLDQYTLVGTTDITYLSDLDNVTINSNEEKYLIDILNRYFKKKTNSKDIIWSYAGVRCLQAEKGHNAINTSRDYKCLMENLHGLPLIVVIGGKLTTHRELAESLVDDLKNLFPAIKPSLTAKIPLPGGDIENLKQFSETMQHKYPWIPQTLLTHYIKNYGTRMEGILGNSKTLTDLGTHFGHGLYQKEVDYLINNEWAQSADDILWRRTKLGLRFTSTEIEALQEYVTTNVIPAC